eukprot:scaffold29419_cov101-Isochrysis_galbana.AAC.3
MAGIPNAAKNSRKVIRPVLARSMCATTAASSSRLHAGKAQARCSSSSARVASSAERKPSASASACLKMSMSEPPEKAARTRSVAARIASRSSASRDAAMRIFASSRAAATAACAPPWPTCAAPTPPAPIAPSVPSAATLSLAGGIASRGRTLAGGAAGSTAPDQALPTQPAPPAVGPCRRPAGRSTRAAAKPPCRSSLPEVQNRAAASRPARNRRSGSRPAELETGQATACSAQAGGGRRWRARRPLSRAIADRTTATERRTRERLCTARTPRRRVAARAAPAAPLSRLRHRPPRRHPLPAPPCSPAARPPQRRRSGLDYAVDPALRPGREGAPTAGHGLALGDLAPLARRTRAGGPRHRDERVPPEPRGAGLAADLLTHRDGSGRTGQPRRHAVCPRVGGVGAGKAGPVAGTGRHPAEQEQTRRLAPRRGGALRRPACRRLVWKRVHLAGRGARPRIPLGMLLGAGGAGQLPACELLDGLRRHSDDVDPSRLPRRRVPRRGGLLGGRGNRLEVELRRPAGVVPQLHTIPKRRRLGRRAGPPHLVLEVALPVPVRAAGGAQPGGGHPPLDPPPARVQHAQLAHLSVRVERRRVELLDFGRPLVVKHEHPAAVAADAAVVGGREDGEQHRVVLDLIPALPLGQLVRSNDGLHPVPLAKRLGHVLSELD